MTITDELYQQVILEHNRNARNCRQIEQPTHSAEGYNPLCGDHYTIQLKLDSNGVILDAAFEGEGCAISRASLSMMTESLKGMTQDQAKALFIAFHDVVTGRIDCGHTKESLGKLSVFTGVCKFPTRVKCAVLGWHALIGALDQTQDAVSTE